METPRISVFVAVYKFGAFLDRCLGSLVGQTLRPWEIVVCDDCSPDHSWEIISDYMRRFPGLVKGHRHAQNVGAVANGIFGYAQTRGDYVSPMDGDDRWRRTKLEREWAALQRCSEADLAYSNVVETDEDDKTILEWTMCGLDGVPPEGDVLIPTYAMRFASGTRTASRNELISRRAFDAEGTFDPGLTNYWDWDRRIRYAARFRFAHVAETLVEWRRHPGGISNVDRPGQIRSCAKVYEKNFHLLEKRTPFERAYVTAHVETVLCYTQRTHPADTRMSNYCEDSVYGHIIDALSPLTDHERQAVCRELEFDIGGCALHSTLRSLRQKSPSDALRHWRSYLRYDRRSRRNWRLALRVLIAQAGLSPGRVSGGLQP